jgi:hypothetical protein
MSNSFDFEQFKPQNPTIIFSNWIYTHTFVLNITEKPVFYRTIL